MRLSGCASCVNAHRGNAYDSCRGVAAGNVINIFLIKDVLFRPPTSHPRASAYRQFITLTDFYHIILYVL